MRIGRGVAAVYDTVAVRSAVAERSEKGHMNHRMAAIYHILL